MATEAQLIVERATLHWLAQQHPDWTQPELARYLSKSVDWVKKWLKRFRQADPNDVTVLHSRSRARKTPPASLAAQPALVQRILEIRETPPENLQRTPGPETILYYLHRDSFFQAAGVRLPRSQAPIWKILRQFGCIAHDPARKHKPREKRAPGEEVQLDLKDIVSVPPDPLGKRQHVVECANFVDAGTSIWLKREVRSDFDAETLVETVVQFLRECGRPRMLTFDHDPRFVGSASGRDFPSALERLLLVLGVEPNLCPPQRPDKNPYVERLHRTLAEECLQIHLPRTLSEAREVTEHFLHHYNHERPHQGRSCANQPPRVACPTFPALAKVPEVVDPDSWLACVHQRAFARRVHTNGSVTINHEAYYVKRTLAGQQVVCFVNAPEKCFDIWQAREPIKQVAIKGLSGKQLPFEEYVTLMKQEARSEYRRYLQTHPVYMQGRLWAS